MAPTARAIEGGEPIDSDPEPWSAMLYRREPNLVQECTGALISPDTVITAAHCVDGPLGIDVVVVGRGDLGDATQGHSSEVAVSDGLPLIIPHPCFALNQDLGQQVGCLEPSCAACNGVSVWANAIFDVALIRLKTPLPEDYPVLPLVPFDTMLTPQDGEVVNLYGYETGGDFAARTPSGSYVHDQSCASWPSMICMVRSPNQPAVPIVSGDSGGPWVVERSEGDAMLVGVHSNSPVSNESVEQAVWLAPDLFTGLWVRETAGLLNPSPSQILRDPQTDESWLVGDDGLRRAIPTVGDFLCFENQGSEVVNLPISLILQVPRQSNEQAICDPTELPSEDFDDPLPERWRLVDRTDGAAFITDEQAISGGGSLAIQSGPTQGSTFARLRLDSPVDPIAAAFTVDLSGLEFAANDTVTLLKVRSADQGIAQVQARTRAGEDSTRLRMRIRLQDGTWHSEPWVLVAQNATHQLRLSIASGSGDDPGYAEFAINGTTVGSFESNFGPGGVEVLRLGILGAKSSTQGAAVFDDLGLDGDPF